MGRYRNDDVAVKVLKQTSGAIESLLEEAMLMQSLRHRNLSVLLLCENAQESFLS